MWAKIAAAFGAPILAAALVIGVLHATHHTAVPPLNFPSVPSAAGFAKSPGSSTKPILPGPCIGRMPKHFAGVAVKKRIEANTATFAKITGHAPQMVEFYNPFLSPFAESQALKVINAGEIPLIQLNPYKVTERQIAAGVYDRHLKRYAQAVRKFGCVIVLSFGHEMNGWWYPWGRPRTSPADFIAAWRHMHDVFTKQGARNVIWSWDPTHQYRSPVPGKVASPASEWYPGSNYVDWVGLDGYLNYDVNGHPQNFSEIFDVQLNIIRHVAPHKLVYLAETAVPAGPAALKQIDNLFSGLSSYHVAGLIWFDALGRLDQTGKRKDFRLQQRPDDAARYKQQLSLFLR